ncbi:hypothetical protein B0H63DRAFT_528047 [Podospora didyma]|uniref:Uncharacterized protein n=1 Tax=Podospora didyma TaxID=330526 RepID=A0AAE0K557_9PEZI|nr:hypothetical protein B0H63DRAFT_528047 [Podospora didyma]
MKQSCLGLFAAALFRLTAAQSTLTTIVTVSTPTVAWTAGPPGSSVGLAATPSAVGGGSSDTAACGQGFTYCGYILRDHQNFKEEDIVKAYCSANKDNCANGKTKTDPIQGLYVCLPPNANPKPKMVKGRQLTTTVIVGGAATPPAVISSTLTLGAPAPPPVGTSPASPLFSPVSSSSSIIIPPGNSQDGAGGCGPSSGQTAQTGNRIELLCSCGNSCLNPLSDHIGRCDAPCS